MKIIFKIFLFFIFCNSTNSCAQDKSLIKGKYIKLMVYDSNNYVILKPCNNTNRFLDINYPYIIDNTGQEVLKCKIQKIVKKSNRTYLILEKDCTYSDTISYEIIDSKKKIVKWFLYNNVSYVSTIEDFQSNYIVKKEKCSTGKEESGLNELNKNAFFLYSYLKEGINKKNISTSVVKNKIESIISKYYTMDDFDKDSFYSREFIKDIQLTNEQLILWKTCKEKMYFKDVGDDYELESNYRYPLDQLKLLKKIIDLYKNENSYGDSFLVMTLKNHIMLYLYFCDWNERKQIYHEIDELRKKLKKENKN